MNKFHEANRASWDASAAWWKAREDERGLWRRCHQEPTLVLSPTEMSFVKGVRGKEACVLGSGDNEVVFALAGLGAKVTSVDISERRLEIAEERARSLGLEATFLRADVTDLGAIEDSRFDLVYTGGHVSVWVSDIRRYYAETVRVLRPGGIFIVNEYHPIRRMWIDGEPDLAPRHRYFGRGPYEYADENTSFEFHWTVADHVQAVLDAGCILLKVEEYGKEEDDMIPAGLRTLPSNLLIVGSPEGVE